MRVTRLEIFGFKSFMERTILPFEPGVTGVVGPNGCGKSNIVDGIRWILGETRASSLRGGVLEDVIFNGTDKLRPLGLAEVSLSIRASGPNLFEDLKSCNLGIDALLREAVSASQDLLGRKDELSADASDNEYEDKEYEDKVEDGKPHLKVIEGGMSDAEEEGPVEDSSISTQRSEALEDLASSALTQFPWLKTATEIQATRRLYRSGDSEFFINRIPCRLKDIKEFFRAIGIAARGYTLVAQGEVARIVTSKPMERRLILEEAAGVLGFRDRIAAAERRLSDTEINVSRLDDVMKEIDRQVAVLKKQADRARNRQALKDQILEKERAIFQDSIASFKEREDDIKREEMTASQDLESSENALQSVSSREMAVRGELLQVDIEGDSMRLKIDALKEELHNRSRQRADGRSRINELRAFVLGKQTEMQRLEERKSTLSQRKEDAQKEANQLLLQERELTEKLHGFEDVGKENLQALGDRLRSQRDNLHNKENEIRSVRDQLISRQSSLESVREQLISSSPLIRLSQTAQSRAAEVFDSQARMLIEGLRVPQELSKAVQAVLAEKAAFLVSDSPHALGAAFMAKAHTVDPDNKNGLGLGAFSLKMSEKARIDGVPFPALLDQIEVEKAFRGVLSSLLYGCFVVESIEQAIAFFKNHPKGLPENLTLVTHDGEILSAHSFFSFQHKGGLVQLRHRQLELQAECEKLSSAQESLQVARDSLMEAISIAESEYKEVLAETERRHALIRELSGALGTLRGKLQAEQRIGAQIDGDLRKAEQQIAEAKLRIEEYQKEQERLEQEVSVLSSSEDEEIRTQLDSLSQKYRSIDALRKEGRNKLEALSKEVQTARANVDAARAQSSHVELEGQRLALEMGSIKERILTEYGENLLEELFSNRRQAQSLDEDTREKYQADVRRLRERILREGEVDPESVDRYESENERLSDLKTQRADMASAAATLKKTISRLQETAEKRFVSVFRAVAQNFSQLIPQLFGGGKGMVELNDPLKPLDSGIEILVRPPGKKPKSIDILSGGEKALTAIALIMSMFLERPSPLCVLDEVDAPLDDANLLRFLSLVKEMSARTQFILITHNKQSMSICDNLIGVTMEEPGASKIISVSLQEAYEQVA